MNEDWKAALSSEIFREYLKNELAKEAQETQQKSLAKKEAKKNKKKTLKQFEELSERIKRDPQLKFAFKTLKEKFYTDPEYRAKTDPNFVNGVMMLFLDDEEDAK